MNYWEKLDLKPEFISRLLEVIFRISLVTYFVFLLVEEIFEGFISNYLSLNVFLIITVLTGFLSILIEEIYKIKKSEKRDYPFIIFLGIIGMLLVFLKTSYLGIWAYLLAIVAGGLIVFILYYLKKI